MDKEIVYIYGLVEPTTKELRYVGKSKDPKVRLRKHISERFKHDSYKDRWIRKMVDSESRPELIIIDEVLKEEWQYWEQHYIAYYRGLGVRLTNSTDGGDQPPSTKGRKHTEESKRRMSETKNGKAIPWLNNGEVRSQEHRDNLSKSCKGRVSEKKGKTYEDIYGEKVAMIIRGKMSEAHIGVYSGEAHPMYGKHHSEKTKKLLSDTFAVPVIQLTKDGKFIKEWESIKVAQEGVNIKSGISNCTNGKQKTAAGFKWKKKCDYEKK